MMVCCMILPPIYTCSREASFLSLCIKKYKPVLVVFVFCHLILYCFTLCCVSQLRLRHRDVVIFYVVSSSPSHDSTIPHHSKTHLTQSQFNGMSSLLKILPHLLRHTDSYRIRSCWASKHPHRMEPESALHNRHSAGECRMCVFPPPPLHVPKQLAGREHLSAYWTGRDFIRPNNDLHLFESLCFRLFNTVLCQGRRGVVLVLPSLPYSSWRWCARIGHIHCFGVYVAAEQARWHPYVRALEEGKQSYTACIYLDLLFSLVVHSGTNLHPRLWTLNRDSMLTPSNIVLIKLSF